MREIIDGDARLNRCEVDQYRTFKWLVAFSVDNYFNSTTRRYHLGTLSYFPNAQLASVEFTFGDEITAPQMREAFYAVTAATTNPFSWTLRPQDAEQVQRVRAIEGTLPMVGPRRRLPMWYIRASPRCGVWHAELYSQR